MLLRNVKDKSIDEQGERMVPAFHKGALVYGEHITRYESVLPILKGKVVLDIASGSGYGSYIIAGQAKKVYGVEIDDDSIAYAKRNYSKENIEYLQGSAEEIPLEDASVDVVVTFETIEHIQDYRTFLKEIKRVLKPGGIALVSTPNDSEFPEGNHFHLHEFEHEELRKELKAHFKNIKFSYQYTWLFAATMNEDSAAKEGPLQNIRLQNLAPIKRDKALYFMVICSDSDITGLEVEQIAALSEHYSARRHTEEKDAQAKELAALKEQIKNKDSTLQGIYESKGWRVLSFIYTSRIKLEKILGIRK